ncbi:hypothetical protein EV421DRAFT_1407829 [Armillaria borealis]|uniref:Uncharacterized protein n=1 Tax=Armillaria borealis TaxID=47425 RepID=A0AA39MXB8_9AGAR|nr:hypothetical protein EV421DRAFT_1407829 [Armillaria borealis]
MCMNAHVRALCMILLPSRSCNLKQPTYLQNQLKLIQIQDKKNIFSTLLITEAFYVNKNGNTAVFLIGANLFPIRGPRPSRLSFVGPI